MILSSANDNSSISHCFASSLITVVAVPAVNLRGGDMITLKGTNMDLVTDVTFPGVEEAVGLESQNSTEIKVLMPAAANSGD